MSIYYNICDYGADKEKTATMAVQQAIDTCHAAGGGMVYCPAGTYVTGSIELKSNVNLHLASGATLVGSTRKEDYIAIAGFSYLVFAEKAENISITGEGTIDGSGDSFFEANPTSTHDKPAQWRPRAMLCFMFCRNLAIKDITLHNSPCYTIWPLACDIVKISGIKLFSNPRGPNTDGIDIDCCSDTMIDNCYINCGDDTIAIKSDCKRLGIKKDCENIVVSNCILVSTCSGIRLGYEGDGAIRNCLFNNIIIHDSQVGIDLLVPHRFDGIDFFIKTGPAIEHVRFTNMRMECKRPFHLWIGDEQEITGWIKDISFSNISVKGSRGSAIFGARNNYVENISFKDVEIEINGQMDSALAEVPYPTICWGFWDNLGLPYGLFCRYVNSLELQNVTINWQETSGDWLDAIKLDHVDNQLISNVRSIGDNPVSMNTPIKMISNS